MSRNKGIYSPIYRNEIQYELNNLIFKYRDLRRLLSFKEITHQEFRVYVEEIKKQSGALVEGEEPIAEIENYSTEDRMIDQEALKSLLGFDTDTLDDDIEACMKDIEDLL